MEKQYKIINGDSLKVLATFEENSIDSIVTDPPYGLTTITKRFGKENSAPSKYGKDGSFARLSRGFMGKQWDGSGIEYNVELWQKAYRVLKPGGYLLAFGGSRTYHRIACAIEDAGFEIRDCIMWLYGSGFPKSHNIGLEIDKINNVESEIVGIGKSGEADTHSRCMNSITKKGNKVFGGQYEIKKAANEWNGWGTALKPAYEPVIVARKPVEETVAKNCLKWGVGGLNIDECRVGELGGVRKINIQPDSASKNCGFGCNEELKDLEMGRFPANVILTYDETDKEEVCGGMPYTKSAFNINGSHETEIHSANRDIFVYGYKNRIDSGFNDEGSAARYFYCAKASKKDRDSGLIQFEAKTKVFNGQSDKSSVSMGEIEKRFTTEGKNVHPTVKPVELMQYLVRLVTPKGGVVLDIFNGSGSTGKAVAFENRERNANYKYIGIELDPEYCKISESRIDYAINKFQYDILETVKENEEKGQLSLFDFGGEE